MGFFGTLSFLFISFVLLAIAGGFITDSARRITDIPGYEGNSNLTRAHGYASWAAVITWISVALILAAGIFFFFFVDEETVGTFQNAVTYLLLFASLAATITVGILSALTAYQIGESKVPDNDLSYEHAIVAGSLAISGFVFLLIALIVRFSKSNSQNNLSSALNSALESDV